MMNTPKIQLITLVGLIMLSCGKEPTMGSDDLSEVVDLINVTKTQFDKAAMTLGKLTEQSIPTVISTRGFVDVPPRSKASISPFHGGYVKDIDILPGQKVKKGELLFTLQNPELIQMQQEYLEIKEQLEYLKLDFERQETLAEENIASQKSLKKSESNYKVMLAKHEGLTAQLKLVNVNMNALNNGKIVSTLPVYSTLTGSITAVNTTKGAFIEQSDIAVVITNVDHLHLELQVFEKDVLLIREEQKIEFSVPESGGEVFVGAVHLVGKSVDGTDRTINVHGHVEDADVGRFIPGMFVEAEIETNAGTGLCLPERAVVELDQEMYVLVKTGQDEETIYFERVIVKTGKSADGWVEILNSNILRDKQVLTEGGFNLLGE